MNCSLFGIGERTGNTPLEAMVFEYAQLRGTLDGMDATVITELADRGHRLSERILMSQELESMRMECSKMKRSIIYLIQTNS